MVLIDIGPPDRHNSLRNPGLPRIWTSLTSTYHHIKIWDLKQRFFVLISAGCKINVKIPLHWTRPSRHSRKVLWGHTVTMGDTEANGYGPWCRPWAFIFPLVLLHIPFGASMPGTHPPSQPQFSQWSWFRIKLKWRKLMQKKPTSNIGLYFQKQPAIFGATAFKSSAWDILSAISTTAERFQLPWKLASEVGAQHLGKPRQCFCKGKMLKLNHLQLGGAIQF